MKKIKGLLKHYLKRRSKVTEALIIIFLITGSIGYSQIIEENNSQVIISNDDTILTIAESGYVDGSEGLDTGLIMDGQNIGTAGVSGNGVIVKLGVSGTSIENKGTIRGSITGTSSEGRISSNEEGNGIYDIDGRSEITNTGMISGNAEFYGRDILSKSASASENAVTSTQISANGVRGKIMTNEGMILGTVELYGGTAIYTQTESGSSLAFSTAEASANGVYGDVMKNMAIISGNGKVEGGDATSNTESNAKSTRWPIRIMSSAYANIKTSANGVQGNMIENIGMISGNAELKGGVATSKLGSTSSFAYAEATESANGILGNITENTGMISGNIKLKGGRGTLTSTVGMGKAYAKATKSANGILGNITENIGKISGSGNLKGGTIDSPPLKNNAYASATSSANGVYGSKVENNIGLIRGHLLLTPGTVTVTGTENHVNEDKIISFSGNGIGYNGTISKISNSGLIMGSESAVAANEIIDNSDPENPIRNTNYGVLAGQQIYGNGTGYDSGDLAALDPANVNVMEHGVHVELDENGSVVRVTNFDSAGIDIDGRTIINTKMKWENRATISKDSYDIFISTFDLSNKIINGAGVGSGVVTVQTGENITMDNSIINGYDTAVTIKDGSRLIASNTIFNGGTVGKYNDNGTSDDILDDYMEYHPIIGGSNGVNTLSIKENSIVNGDIDLGRGNDNLIISNTTQLNGDLYGGDGIDNLQLGDGTLNNESGLSIFGKIENFENINIKGEVTLYETAKIMKTDTNIEVNKIMRTNTNMEPDNIYIGSNNILNLRINPGEINGLKEIIGHALYGSNLIISAKEDKMMRASSSTTSGTFNIITNGLGLGGTVAMSDDEGNKVTFDENISIETDSIIYNTNIDSSGDIVVNVKQGLDDDISYPKLDLVYKSITSSGDFNINALYPTVGGIGADKTSEDAKKELLFLLNDIFAENPYGYASYSSKESMNIFDNLILNSPFRASDGEWMVYGGAAYKDSDSKTGYSKNNFDNDIDVDENIYGGYALAEYGISKDASVGVIVGGTNSKVDISNGSKLEGNSFYIGTYGMNEINNFRLKAGIGYQYTDYDATRIAANTYQYEKYENPIITNGFSAYTGVIYSYELGKKYFLEPKLNLTYTRISQNSVNEGKEALAIEADAKTINYLDTEMGLDLVKEFRLNKSTIKIKGGVSYLYALDGADEDYITGRMDEGSDFDILVPERDKGRGKIGSSLEVEQYNGFIYNIGGGCITGSNVNEYYVGTGIGFKF